MFWHLYFPKRDDSARRMGMKMLLAIFYITLTMVLLGTAAIAAGADTIIRERKTFIDPGYCYAIRNIRIEENGYVTLRFGKQQKFIAKYCPKNIIYNVTTIPANSIRGSRGVSGRTPNKTFYIQVTPKTSHIILKILERGLVKSRTFKIKAEIASIQKLINAEQSTPTWQKAFKNTESKLAAKAKADKTPPKISLLSPNVTPKKKVFRVDTYQTYIRGTPKLFLDLSTECEIGDFIYALSF